jgi:sugar phosphate isomerase/epimerase
MGELSMKLGCIDSAFNQAGRGREFGLRQIKQIGFDSCDLFIDPLDAPADEIDLIRRVCKELDLPIISVCCVAVGLIDLNPSVQRFHVDRCRKFLDLVAGLGARNLLLVLGEYIWQREVIPPEEQWKWAVENCRVLGEHAKGRGVEIVMELEPFKLSLLDTMDSMIRFLNDVDHPAVRANCDVSHMVLSNSGPEAVAGLGDRLGHVHLSDCDGKVHGDLPPGRGVVDFVPYLQAIAQAGFDGVVSLELEYAPEPDKIVEWVSEAYEATDKLLQEAGITRG